MLLPCLGSLALAFLSHALPPRPPTLAAPPRLPTPLLSSEPFAALVICTNSNICGKHNPTNAYGYGFAFRAIECLRVLAPPGLRVLPGPCFIRCSAGVNAKLLLPDGKPSASPSGRRLTDGTPYYRLNSVAACVAWLEEQLGARVDARRLAAYAAYAEACDLLCDDIRGLPRGDLRYDLPRGAAAAEASAALSRLDEAAAYVLGERLAPCAPPAAARRTFRGSAWEESFLSSTLRFEGGGEGEEEGEEEEERGGEREESFLSSTLRFEGGGEGEEEGEEEEERGGEREESFLSSTLRFEGGGEGEEEGEEEEERGGEREESFLSSTLRFEGGGEGEEEGEEEEEEGGGEGEESFLSSTLRFEGGGEGEEEGEEEEERGGEREESFLSSTLRFEGGGEGEEEGEEEEEEGGGEGEESFLSSTLRFEGGGEGEEEGEEEEEEGGGEGEESFLSSTLRFEGRGEGEEEDEKKEEEAGGGGGEAAGAGRRVAARGTFGQAAWARGGGAAFSGWVEGAERGGVWEGAWGEGERRGTARLRLSADGLSFEGRGEEGGAAFAWRGVRVAAAAARRGGARRRWGARVLALRSAALLAVGRVEEAVEDAAAAVATCAWLPAAWEAAAEAALAAEDGAAAAVCLRELLFLEPERDAALPQRVANARRAQRLKLEQLAAGKLRLGPSVLRGINPIAPYLLSEPRRQAAPRADAEGGEQGVRNRVAGDALQEQMNAIFSESYGSELQ